jgi:multisubunit Na+/H+ antiporter MnhC subunit
MLTPIAAAFIVFITVAVFLFVARRLLRIALKLAIVCALFISLLVIAGVGWWRGWFAFRSFQHPVIQSNRQANVNRRRP